MWAKKIKAIHITLEASVNKLENLNSECLGGYMSSPTTHEQQKQKYYKEERKGT